jgi:hypothetical protein
MMNDEQQAKSDDKAPKVNTASTRVTVAFPFSSIKTNEPSEDLRELAAIADLLADELAALHPSSRTEALAKRARALVAKLA